MKICLIATLGLLVAVAIAVFVSKSGITWGSREWIAATTTIAFVEAIAYFAARKNQ